MGIQRSAIIGGPAKVALGTKSFLAVDDITFNVEITTNPVVTSMYGIVDDTVSDVVVRVGMTPLGIWREMSTLIPPFYTNGRPGARLFGNEDVPLKIWSNNQDLYTVTSAAVIKPPSLHLGADKPLYGPMEFIGVIGNGKDMGDMASLYQIQYFQPDPTGETNLSDFKQQQYTAVWGNVMGFGGPNGFIAEDGWTIDWDVTMEPVKIQGRTIDYKLKSMRAMARCTPIGPSADNIDMALRIQGPQSRLGQSLGAGAIGDLMITGEDGSSIWLSKAVLKEAGFVFGGRALRNGELGWVTEIKPVAGMLPPPVTITNQNWP